MKNSVLALIGAMFLALVSMPANAQGASRTWVSGVGDDSNPCSNTAPCKTFAGAIAKTLTGGEINCLTPGGFGALTITKPIAIICLTEAGVLVSGTNGIVVSLSTPGKVVLDGLDIEGLGTGLSGIRMIGQGELIVRNTSIRDFTAYGIDEEGTAGTPATRVVVQNCLITHNGNSTTGGGFFVQGASGATNNAQVINTLIDANGTFNISVNAAATMVLSASTLTGTTPTSIVVGTGGSVISYGNNVLRNGGSPTSTVPLQ